MTHFETVCPNDHPVKFILEMCGRVAQCPKCCAKFELPRLEEVRQILGDDISEELKKELKEAEIKLRHLNWSEVSRKTRMAAAENLSRPVNVENEFEALKKENLKETEQKSLKKMGDKKIEQRNFAKAAERDCSLNPLEKEEELEAEQEREHEEALLQFLCPNGHELSASAKMAGKKGKCPECGEKFIIPIMENTEEADPFDLDTYDAEPDIFSFDSDKKKAGSGDLFADSITKNAAVKTLKKPVPPSISIAKDSGNKAFLYPNLAVSPSGAIDLGIEEARHTSQEALKMDQMAKFFWTLWNSEPENLVNSASELNIPYAPPPKGTKSKLIGTAMKSHQSGKIEIQTADGKTFIPLEFYEDKSLSPIGFFEALDENKNSVTLVIRWENVVRIVVKK